jgi:nicotinamidase-related amidase
MTSVSCSKGGSGAPVLVAVDFQGKKEPKEAFLRVWQAPDGTYFVNRIKQVIPRVNKLTAAVRAAGGSVIWIRPEVRIQDAADWPQGYQVGLRRIGMVNMQYEGLSNFELFPELDVREEDYFVSKFCTSAFWGGTMNQVLRELDPSQVLFTGVLTDAGVVVNAVDSTSNGFNTMIVEDGCVAFTEEQHTQSLWVQRRLYSITTSKEVLETLA